MLGYSLSGSQRRVDNVGRSHSTSSSIYCCALIDNIWRHSVPSLTAFEHSSFQFHNAADYRKF